MRSLALRFLLACGLWAGAFAAEPEIVQVNGEGLSGIWKIASPEWAAVDYAGTASFGPLLDRFCRTERAAKGFKVHCIGWDYRNFHSEGKLDGAKIHLYGGFMLLRFMYDGELTSPTSFTGTFGVRVVGFRLDDPETVRAGKLLLAPEAPDVAGHADALRGVLTEIAGAAPEAPSVAAANKRGDFNQERLTPTLLQQLGAVQAVIYIGDAPQPKSAKDKHAGAIAVYDVEFAHGERLCAVDKEHGVTSGIVCA